MELIFLKKIFIFSYFRELSDVDADGELNLSEFSVAMHLVVLHRNGIMLPNQLPESLRAVATSSALSAPPPSSSTDVLVLSPEVKDQTNKAKNLSFIKENKHFLTPSKLYKSKHRLVNSFLRTPS